MICSNVLRFLEDIPLLRDFLINFMHWEKDSLAEQISLNSVYTLFFVEHLEQARNYLI